MKNYIILITIFFSLNFYAQESFLKEYKISINNCCHKLYYNDIVDTIKFKDFTFDEKKKFKEKYIENTLINYTSEEIINGEKVILNNSIFIDSDFYKKQTKTIPKEVLNNNFSHKKGHVKMVGDKLYINQVESKKVYFYKLISGQEFRLSFSEWTVSALTIPIKYRFKQKALPKDIEEDFASSININMFIGRSFGKTNFMYRKKVDNKINTWKLSGGLIIGTSTITLTSNNTSASNNPINENDTFNKGLLSIGFGGAYSFNAINFGFFYGWDYGIGESANSWNYNKKPWLGLAIG